MSKISCLRDLMGHRIKIALLAPPRFSIHPPNLTSRQMNYIEDYALSRVSTFETNLKSCNTRKTFVEIGNARYPCVADLQRLRKAKLANIILHSRTLGTRGNTLMLNNVKIPDRKTNWGRFPYIKEVFEKNIENVFISAPHGEFYIYEIDGVKTTEFFGVDTRKWPRQILDGYVASRVAKSIISVLAKKDNSAASLGRKTKEARFTAANNRFLRVRKQREEIAKRMMENPHKICEILRGFHIGE